MGRTDEFFGANNVDHMFPHGALTTSVPWAPAGPTRTHRAYDVRAVTEAVNNPQQFKPELLDPRGLRATQPGLQRAATKYYLDNPNPARTFADPDHVGNQTPVAFHNEMTGHTAILSGHHRAAAALLRGDQFNAIVVSGKPSTHIEAAQFQRDVIDMQRRARKATRDVA